MKEDEENEIAVLFDLENVVFATFGQNPRNSR